MLKLAKIIFFFILIFTDSIAFAAIDKNLQNFETSRVNITAVDAPGLHIINGKASLGVEQRLGQGVIIDPNGVIVTNTHIVGDAPRHIYVKIAGGKKFNAELIKNGNSDLTFIKIRAPYPLHAVTLGDSSRVQIGNPVIALPNAVLNHQKKKNGVIIQVYTEAATNKVAILEMNIRLRPGDSGGPIINSQGSLLGLILANQISDPNKSYAIASNKIREEYLKYRVSALMAGL